MDYLSVENVQKLPIRVAFIIGERSAICNPAILIRSLIRHSKLVILDWQYTMTSEPLTSASRGLAFSSLARPNKDLVNDPKRYVIF